MHSSASLRELSRGGVSFVRGDRSHHAGAPARGWLFYRINIGFSFSASGSSAVLSGSRHLEPLNKVCFRV